MVRIIFAENYVLNYLTSLSEQNSFAIGIVVGQSIEDKYYIVHLARTNLVFPEEDKPLSKVTLAEVNDIWVADQGKQAARMLPGGLQVLGIFLITEENVSKTFPPKIKSILNQLHRQLNCDYLSGNTDCNEKLVLSFSTKTKQCFGKTYDLISSFVKPIDIIFQDKPIKWVKIECRYELDECHHVNQKNLDIDLEKRVNLVLQEIHKNLKSSVFLFDGELRDGDECLDSAGKKKKNLRGSKVVQVETNNSNNENKAIVVSILQSCNESQKQIVVNDVDNEIRLVGHLASTVWLHSSVSFNVATASVIEDIMRSISTRLEMHWDSLIEEEHKGDGKIIHEPPRRVLVALPDCKITMSDYLFPGEGPEEARLSVEETLDIKLTDTLEEVQDIEGVVDIKEVYKSHSHPELDKIEERGHTRVMFILGSLFAVFVLIVSIIIHLTLNSGYFPSLNKAIEVVDKVDVNSSNTQ